LAVKGIIGLAAYAKILEISGDSSVRRRRAADIIRHHQELFFSWQGAVAYQRLATRFMSQWMELAATNDTGVPHYKLQYDKPQSWSLKVCIHTVTAIPAAHSFIDDS